MKKKNLLSFLLPLLYTVGLNAQESCISFYIESESAASGDTVWLDMMTNEFHDITALYMAVYWDQEELELLAVDNFGLPNMDEYSFNLSPDFINSGQTLFTWLDNNLEGVSLPDGERIFSLQFVVKADEGQFAGVRPGPPTDDAPIDYVEIIRDHNELEQNYSLLGGGVGVGIDSPAAFKGGCINFGDCTGHAELVPLASGKALAYEWRSDSSALGTDSLLMDAHSAEYELLLSDTAGTLLQGLFSCAPQGQPSIDNYDIKPVRNCDGAPGSISVSPSGGAGYYTYQWSNGGSLPNTSGLDTGTYQLTVTDFYGCMDSTSFVVPGINDVQFSTTYAKTCTPLPPDSSTVDISCSVLDGGTPPYTFTWSTGYSETDSLRSLLLGAPGNGTYQVSITDAKGCTYVDEPVTTDCLNETIENCDFDTGHDQECFQLSEGTARADLHLVVWDGGTPPYTFEWSNGFVDTADILSTLTDVPGQGTYSVTITDSDTCTYFPDPITINCPGSHTDSLLSAEEVTAQAGEEVCINVSLNLLQAITDFQAQMEWDSSVLNFSRIEEAVLSFASGQLDTSELANGRIGVDWAADMPAGVSLNGETVLFQLCFEVAGAPGSVSALAFTENPQTINFEGDTTSLKMDDGAVFVKGDSSLLTLAIEEASANPGEAVCLPLSVQNFSNVTGVQFTLEWNPNLLTFDSLQIADLPNPSGSLGPHHELLEEGTLTFVWMEPTLQPISLDDGAALFNLCFTAGSSIDSAEVRFSNDPTPVAINDGDTLLPAQFAPGTVYLQQGDVWPGDTDVNQEVEPEDLLNIGLAFGAAGPVRPNASIDWSGQYAEVWNQRTPAGQIDYKHVDTNGDGFVDEADTLAIVQNMGASTNLLPPSTEPSELLRSTGAPLYVEAQDTLVPGTTTHLDIVLGESNFPAEDVYGLSFTIVYDSAAVVPGSAWAKFTPSWVGNWGTNLLSLQRNRPSDHRIDIAMTRTDGLNQSGNGAIGQLRITIQDVIFLRSEIYEMEFRVEDVRIISVDETELPVTTPSTQATIEPKPVNSDEEARKAKLKVFPIPARDQLWLRSHAPIERLALMRTDGQVVLRKGSTDMIDLRALPAGWYLLRVWTQNGVVHHPVIVK